MVQLTEHQKEIADSIIRTKQVRTSLAGLAGTGKTTVAQYIYQKWLDQGLRVAVLAPTGKASQVLRAKGVPAITIHRGIYHYKGKFQTPEGETELVFKDNHNGKFCDRLIVDEASMVTRKHLEDIEARNIPALFVGDNGQLPPVKSRRTTLLTRPSHGLREIHRQAAGSPIIKFAYALRNGAELSERFAGINRVSCQGKGPTYVAGAMIDRGVERLIVKTNAQRVALNLAYRGVTDRKGVVCPGDEIICVLNNKPLGVVNGELFKVLEVMRSQAEWTLVRIESLDTDRTTTCKVWNDQFGRERTIDDEIDQQYMLADYAYAITCHKFQGSSARHVGITARGYCGDNSRCWNYTAATRAEEEITVFC